MYSLFKEISAEVQKIWDEAHKGIEEQSEAKDEEEPEEKSHQDTFGSTEADSSQCCGMEFGKVNLDFCYILSIILHTLDLISFFPSLFGSFST